MSILATFLQRLAIALFTLFTIIIEARNAWNLYTITGLILLAAAAIMVTPSRRKQDRS